MAPQEGSWEEAHWENAAHKPFQVAGTLLLGISRGNLDIKRSYKFPRLMCIGIESIWQPQIPKGTQHMWNAYEILKAGGKGSEGVSDDGSEGRYKSIC